MKKTIYILLSLGFIGLSTAYSQVKVGDNPTTIHSSAALEVESSNKGFLPPRMTTTERDAIPSPPAGLLIYNNTTKSLEVSNGTNWLKLSDGLASGAIGSGTAPTATGIGIGTATPDGNAIIDIESSTQGFLPPRMSSSNRPGFPAEGLTIYNTTLNCLEFFNGLGWQNICDGSVITLITSGPCAGELEEFTFDGLVYRPVESQGRCWLDRNLGATRVAQTSDDFQAYGSLYQWGRGSDGHQLITWTESSTSTTNNTLSSTQSTQSNTDQPGHGDFITTTTNDWRSSQNDNLWQGVNGVNNPCPNGYRLPSNAEWTTEHQSWTSQNTTGSFNSPLKLPRGGYRVEGSGGLLGVGEEGNYWSMSTTSNSADYMRVTTFNGSVTWNIGSRARGLSARCIKD